jgi:YjjG family noncanonical pyrimidine nucleotidase
VPRYQCVFFDLDHTLWDYETNSSETLFDLYHRYELLHKGVTSFPEFFKTFIRVNNQLWDDYDRGHIHRDVLRLERFHRVLKEAGVDDFEMSLRLSKDYLSESPKGKNLMPQTLETLDYLVSTYPLYIITNGFDEIQSTKLASSGILKYFKKIFTSEQVGHKKPEREIFDYALKQNGFLSHQAIMIGDNLLTDMAGARNAEVDHVFFNPNKISHQESVTYEINSLHELKNIL